MGSKERAYEFLNQLHYALNATNIGDARTLVIHPASTIYLHSTLEQMHAAGVEEDTIRVSVGIEDSHPESPSRPSEEDKCLAYDSNASYMILSLMEPENPVLNSFHIEGADVTKEELIFQ